MLELTLTHDPVPALLYSRYPTSVGEVTDPKPTNFGFGVTVSSPDERVRSGGLVAVWQTALFNSTYPEDSPKGPGDGEWSILHTIVVPIREDDFVIEEGTKQSYVFNFSLPANLYMSRVTPWERIAHVAYVFALAPSPTYSVIPVMRDDDAVPVSPSRQSSPPGTPAIPERRRSSLLDGLRKLSIGSASSAGSTKSKGSSNGKKKSKVAELDDDSEPPMPKLEQPFIAEAHEEIIVVATTDEPGQMHSLNVEREVKNELGTIKLHAMSDMFIVGSGFLCCVLITDLHPMATLHAFRVTMTQRLQKPDRSVEHVDRYTLYSRGRSYVLDRTVRPSEDSILWRGEGARAVDAAAGHKRAPEAPASSDSVHLVCAPRMPSSVMGARPTRHNFDPGFSTNSHSLEFTFFWSVYGQDENGNSLPENAKEEGAMRTTTVMQSPTVGACGFNAASVVVPGYGVGPSESVDLAGCMEPYKPGTEPESFRLRKESWVEWGGRVQRVRKPYDVKSFDFRQHQFDTGSLCVCFYPMAPDPTAPARPRAIMGELDLAEFRPVEGGFANFAAEKQRRVDAWWAQHRGERTSVPGFGHFLLERCLCDQYRRDKARGESRGSSIDEGERTVKSSVLSWEARG